MTIGFRRLLSLLEALIVPALTALPARAADFPVVVDCPGWGGETAGQVEARIRAALQADGLSATDISVTCREVDALEVRVVSPDGALTRQVERRSERVEDDVVWTVEAALDDLSKSAAPEIAEAPVLPATPPAPVVPPTPAAPAPLTVTSLVPAPATTPARSEAELAVRLLLERMAGVWAPGAEAGVSVGSDSLRYGLALGGRLTVAAPSEFRLSELTGSARFSFSPRRAAGIRLELGSGVSVLSAEPQGGAVAQSGTTVSAVFAELALSRPFWLGSFAVSPALGARAFLARRTVEVDGQERFRLPTVVPQLGLSLVHRR